MYVTVGLEWENVRKGLLDVWARGPIAGSGVKLLLFVQAGVVECFPLQGVGGSGGLLE